MNNGGWKRDYDCPCVVYIVTNSINGKRYIGVTSKTAGRRLSEHLYTARLGGNGAFYRAIRKHGRDAFSVHILTECKTVREGLIEEMRLIAELAPEYNSTKGGDGQLGRLMSEETRRKISLSKKGQKSRLGIPHSAATKKRLSDIGKTNESLLRWRESARLGPISMMRPVVCLDDGRKFDSATDAAGYYGVAKSALIELCLGKRYRKTVGGLRFSYLDAA